MKQIDVFNGDADGICALHLLRLLTPCPDARLVTGVKRNNTLLSQLTDISDTAITVLDISLDRNRQSLETLLAQNNHVVYVDHHYAGEFPVSPNIEIYIDPSPLTCTSLIVHSCLLPGTNTPWAIAGAFGDNLDEPAIQLASQMGLNEQSINELREIGILLNYNGYGTRLEDLFFDPKDLYIHVHDFEDPFVFFSESPILQTLRDGYQQDMDNARTCSPVHADTACRVFILPQAAWARRVAGVYANTLVREEPNLAHALVTTNTDGSYRVSARAPLNNRSGADVVCRQFPSGGGRAAAAGINSLPVSQFDDFVTAFSHQFTP
jgi:hypothetical protein